MEFNENFISTEATIIQIIDNQTMHFLRILSMSSIFVIAFDNIYNSNPIC